MAMKWEICSTCEGEGKESAYLGAFTASEFDEFFDADSVADYFAGAYDRRCSACDGTGKVQIAGCDINVPIKCEPCADWYAEIEMEGERRAEMRMGC